MSLNAQVMLSALVHESSEDGVSRSLRATPAAYSLTLSDGTGASQSQVAWSSKRALAGASETINVASLPDDRGTVTMTSVTVFFLANRSTAALTATPSGAAGAFGGTHHVRPGGAAIAAAADAGGMPAGSLVISGSAGQEYEIVLVGRGSVS